MRKIRIQTIKKKFLTLFNKKELISLCKTVLEREGILDYDITVIFVDESYIVELNKRFFNDDTYTDVISFNLGDDNVEGEVYVNCNIIKEQAEYYKVNFNDELKRIVIHGLLHLAGDRDYTIKEKKSMREKEDYYLNLAERGDA